MATVLVLVLTTAIFVVLVFIFYFFFLHFQPGFKKVQKDLAEIKQQTSSIEEQLIPWSGEEMELLSLKQIHQKKGSGILGSGQGVFTSIYDEPMVLYAYKNYIATRPNNVIWAKTAQHEYVYRTKNGRTSIHLNDQLIGDLSQDGQLVAPRTKELLAKVERNSHLDLIPVQVGSKEVASIINPDKAETLNSRAVQLINESMQAQEEVLFLALLVHEMIRRGMNH